ncbi:MAG: 4Fe-4S cluster-binding domain-containing protein [Nanoarchaeota archaeon]|nr:4Fe-4S cluster-binding domain-containing protein [Nanoarchaeota archaeon]
MKANNLTISIPTVSPRCDKNCPYCISEITWKTKPNPALMLSNLKKVKNLIKVSGVSNILITSKGEPFLNKEMLQIIMMEFRDYWLEIQTNGLQLKRNIHDFVTLLSAGQVNIVAFSVDQPWDVVDLSFVFKRLEDFGIISRVCLNITDRFKDYFCNGLMENAKVNGVKQLLFRNINYPSNADKENKAVKWIDKNVDKMIYIRLHKEMMEMNLPIIREIKETETKTFDYNGISVCFSDYCIQEKNEVSDIRSLIFHEDGHVYTSWNTPASILF